MLEKLIVRAEPSGLSLNPVPPPGSPNSTMRTIACAIRCPTCRGKDHRFSLAIHGSISTEESGAGGSLLESRSLLLARRAKVLMWSRLGEPKQQNEARAGLTSCQLGSSYQPTGSRWFFRRFGHASQGALKLWRLNPCRFPLPSFSRSCAPESETRRRLAQGGRESLLPTEGTATASKGW